MSVCLLSSHFTWINVQFASNASYVHIQFVWSSHFICMSNLTEADHVLCGGLVWFLFPHPHPPHNKVCVCVGGGGGYLNGLVSVAICPCVWALSRRKLAVVVHWIIMSQGVMPKNWDAIFKVKVRIPKHHCFYFFWTNDSFVTRPSLVCNENIVVTAVVQNLSCLSSSFLFELLNVLDPNLLWWLTPYAQHHMTKLSRHLKGHGHS